MSLPDLDALTPMSPRWGGRAAAMGLGDTRFPLLGPSAAWGWGRRRRVPRELGGRGHQIPRPQVSPSTLGENQGTRWP